MSGVALRDYQDEAIDRVLKARERGVNKQLGVAAVGMGKGLVEGTPVLTPAGWVPVETLSIGDDVIGANGMGTRVEGVFHRGVQPCFEVATDDGITVTVDGDHLWTVTTDSALSRGKPWRTTSTNDLYAGGLTMPGGRLRWRLPVVSPVRNPTTDLPIDPYILGVLIADGSLTQRSVLFTPGDDEIALRVKDLLPPEMSLTQTSDDSRATTYRIVSPNRGRGSSNPLMASLESMGLQGHSALTKFVPPCYLDADAPERLELLRGLMDCDGWIGTSLQYTTSSPMLAQDVMTLIRSLGGVPRLTRKESPKYTYKGEVRTGQPSYNVTFKIEQCPFNLKRKAETWNGKRRVPPSRKLASITPVGDNRTVCIKVAAPDGLFVTKDYLVTHNTIIFSSLAMQMNVPTLILAHRDELISQAVEKLLLVWPEADVGVVKAERNEIDHQVVVASVQSLRKPRLAKMDPRMFDGGLVISDEAHHSAATSYRSIYEHFGCGTPEGPLHLGVTATPNRGDGGGLDKVFSEIVFNYDMLWGIQRGYLADLKGLRIHLKDVDFTQAKISNGDYAAGEVGQMLENADAPDLIVAAWLEHAIGRRTIVFTPTVDTASLVSEAFQAAGVNADMVSAKTPVDERRLLLKRFSSGDLDVLVNVGILTEGYDNPEVSCIVMARPTKSASLFIQCLSSDTEILTPLGWRGVDDVYEGDSVYSWDEGVIRSEPVLEKFDRLLGEGEAMYGIQSPALDIRVTGGHRMVVSRRSGRDRHHGEWSFESAETVSRFKDSWRLPVSGLEDVPDVGISDDLVRLAAWVITDGTFNKSNNAISISQNLDSPSTPQIEGILTRLGLKFGAYEAKEDTNFGSRRSPSVRYSISKGQPRGRGRYHLNGWNAIAPWLGDREATMSLLSNLSERQFDLLVSVINDADGAKPVDLGWEKATHDITKGLKFCEWLQSLAVRRGWKANLHEFTTPHGTPMGCLHLKKAAHAATSSSASDRPTFQQLEPVEGERVWCVSVTSETLVTRRNGKVAIVGNCIGRATRKHPDKKDALIIDVCGASDENSLVSIPSLFGIEPKDREKFDASEETIGEFIFAMEKEKVRRGEMQAKAIDLFQKVIDSPINWTHFTSRSGLKTYAINLGFDKADGTIVIEHLGGEEDEKQWHSYLRWDRGVTPVGDEIKTFANGDSYRTLIRGVDLEMAQGVGEDFVRKNGASAITNKNAAWRDRPPTEKQLAAAEKWRIAVDPNWTAGDLSSAIDAKAQASKHNNKDKAPRKPPPSWVTKGR